MRVKVRGEQVIVRCEYQGGKALIKAPRRYATYAADGSVNGLHLTSTFDEPLTGVSIRTWSVVPSRRAARRAHNRALKRGGHDAR